MQKIVIVDHDTITVQSSAGCWSGTLAQFLAEGGCKPPFESLNYNADTGGCWVNGAFAAGEPIAWAEAVLAKLPQLMDGQAARHQKTTDDRTAEQMAESEAKAAAEEAARLAAMTLDDVKAEKLAEINAACDALLNETVSSYPDSEVQTFNQQVTEAERYLATNEPEEAPLLSGIAQARNITLIDLVSRVLQKRNAYTKLCGVVIGQRQALEDQLDALTDIDAVRAMPVAIALPD